MEAKAAIVTALCTLAVGCTNLTSNPIEDGLSGWSCYLETPGAKQQDTWKIEGGVLKCIGTPRGYLYTDDSYTNFVLTLEWRWPDEKIAGKGGVLIDTTGDHKIWPKSLEAQINANGAGDFWALNGYELAGIPGRTKSFDHKQFGKLTNVGKIEAAEKPAGQWNSYEIIAHGTTVTLMINGRLVNKGTRPAAAGGKICITSEGTPIYFRNIRLTRKD
jgi:hypothetical protein